MPTILAMCMALVFAAMAAALLVYEAWGKE